MPWTAIGLLLLATLARRILGYSHTAESVEENKAYAESLLALVGTVDGNVHAFDGQLRRLWTASTGSSLASAHHRRTFASPLSLGGDEEKRREVISMVPALDGTILLHNAEGMRKTSVTARMLAENTPYETANGFLFAGSKTSRIMGFNLADGSVVQDIGWQEDRLLSSDNEHNEPLASTDLTQTSLEKSKGFSRRSGGSSRPQDHGPFWLGRTDYKLRAVDARSGVEELRLSYSDLTPILDTMRHRLRSSGDKTSKPLSFFASKRRSEAVEVGAVASLPLAECTSIASTPRGALNFLDIDGRVLHEAAIELSSPVVHAYVIKLLDGEPVQHSKIAVQHNLRSFKRIHQIQYSPQSPTSALVVSTSYRDEELELNDDLDRVVLVQSTPSLDNSDEDEALYAIEVNNLLNYNVELASNPSTAMRSLLGPADNTDEVSEATELMAEGSESESESEKLIAVSEESGTSALCRRPERRLTDPYRPRRDEGLTVLRARDGSDRSFCSAAVAPVSVSVMAEDEEAEKARNKTIGLDLSLTSYDWTSKLVIRGNDEEDPHKNVNSIRGFHKFLKASAHDEENFAALLKHHTHNALSKSDRLQNRLGDKQKSYGRNSDLLDRSLLSRFIFILLLMLLSLVIGGYCTFYLLIQSSKVLKTAGFEAESLIVTGAVRSFSRWIGGQDAAEVSNASQKVSMVSEVEMKIDSFGRKVMRIGALSVYDQVLGLGSHGTVVFLGGLNGRPIAVKRMLSQFNKAAEREISLLIRSDGHPNVVRYFLKEQREDFVYLGLQLCEMSLKDFIVRVRSHHGSEEAKYEDDGMVSDEVRTSLLQIAEGLAHLHSQRIVHRDIKPHNILCASPKEEADDLVTERKAKSLASIASLHDLSKFVLKISDMGLSKQLDRDEHSFSSFSLSMASMTGLRRGVDGSGMDTVVALEGPVGTVGWQAPELISARGKGSGLSTDGESELGGDEVESSSSGMRRKRTLTVDVFSLGCVLYYMLTLGEHPFGEWYDREANIAHDRSNLNALQSVPDAVDLISAMVSHDPEKRPTSSEVCCHPFFWTASKRLDFLVEFSDRLEKEAVDSSLVLAVESNALNVVGSRWDKKLDLELLEDMGKYRKYDMASTRDLLRVIRNKRHHFHELSVTLKEKIGSIPNGFFAYFDRRFPLLLMHCFAVARRFLLHETHFTPWLCSHRHAQLPAPSPALLTSSLLGSISESGKGGVSISHESGPIGTQTSSKLVDTSSETSNPKGRNLNNNSSEAMGSQNGEGKSLDVVVWHGSSLQTSLRSKGWWRDLSSWSESPANYSNNKLGSGKKNRPSHLSKAATDMKYRTRLCTHWETTQGFLCPMRKKGKCIFAHGPLELRVKETRRDKWARSGMTASSSTGAVAAENLRVSGGEDVLGAARSIEKVRVMEGSVSEFEMSTGYIASSYPPVPPPPYLPIPSNSYYPSMPAAGHGSHWSHDRFAKDPG